MGIAFRTVTGRARAAVPGFRPSPRSRRAVTAATAATAALLALGACSDDAKPEQDAKPSAEPPPLRFHPVEDVRQGACPQDEPGVWIENTSTPDVAECLLLQDATALRLTSPVEASAELSQNAGGWTVQIQLSDQDGQRFGELSANAATQTPPKNRIAIVLGEGDGGRVLSAPQVHERIHGGTIVVSGTFRGKDARKLAAELNG
ncbi:MULTISPECIES: SecDF P1 head subdomain-containing protein [unclassified Streptomyces]|uniref:SecDF P1 head subdomain-containing protein n=1 Tax=unclassified Streptomyces TaxID=2593676 RepID=UPI0022B678A9|nr:MULTISPECIES: hypothetical protein [unclassified Streptomyces]MCZ7416977.1 hypothetical protein [Streptomyces sp. WMMC897]MCZ7433193.1 hypothetical protein [Streptomyces sp. WMMC1477]